MDQVQSGMDRQHTQNPLSENGEKYFPNTKSNMDSFGRPKEQPNTPNEIGKAALFNRTQENPNNNTQEMMALGSEFNFPLDNNEGPTQSSPRDDVSRNDGLTSSYTENCEPSPDYVQEVDGLIKEIENAPDGEDLSKVYDTIRGIPSSGENAA